MKTVRDFERARVERLAQELGLSVIPTAELSELRRVCLQHANCRYREQMIHGLQDRIQLLEQASQSKDVTVTLDGKTYTIPRVPWRVLMLVVNFIGGDAYVFFNPLGVDEDTIRDALEAWLEDKRYINMDVLWELRKDQLRKAA